MSDLEEMQDEILEVFPYILILDLLFSAGIIVLFTWLFSISWGTTIGFYLIINALWAIIDFFSFFLFWFLIPAFLISFASE